MAEHKSVKKEKLDIGTTVSSEIVKKEKFDIEITVPSKIADLTTYTNEVLKLKKFFKENPQGIIKIGESFVRYDRNNDKQLEQLPVTQKRRSIFEIVDLTPSTLKFLQEILDNTPASSPKMKQTG